MSGVILVEGDSDRAALETLAERLGRDLEAEAVSVVATGGASSLAVSLGRVLASYPSGTAVAGLCDEAEADQVRQALERIGLGSGLSLPEMEALGFFVCVRDLEDELIRSLGPVVIEEVLAEQGELRKFRKFQNQPQWRGRPVEQQFHRFTGIKSGRKVRYGRVLVQALDLSRIPRPLAGVLASV